MKWLWFVIVVLVACGGRDPIANCASVAIGTDVSTLKDRRSGNCIRKDSSTPSPGVEDAMCCMQKHTNCGISCTPPVTAEEYGPQAEPQVHNVYWCCLYVQDGKVIAKNVWSD